MNNSFLICSGLFLFSVACSDDFTGKAADTSDDNETETVVDTAINTDINTDSDTFVDTNSNIDTGTTTHEVTQIEAECAFGLLVGDCNSAFAGAQNGTELGADETSVGYFDGGDYLLFEGVDLAGEEAISVHYAKGTEGGTVEIRIDAIDGTLVGTFTPENTGDWETWQDGTVAIDAITGAHDLCFVGVGGEGIVNFDWILIGI